MCEPVVFLSTLECSKAIFVVVVYSFSCFVSCVVMWSIVVSVVGPVPVFAREVRAVLFCLFFHLVQIPSWCDGVEIQSTDVV